MGCLIVADKNKSTVELEKVLGYCRISPAIDPKGRIVGKFVLCEFGVCYIFKDISVHRISFCSVSVYSLTRLFYIVVGLVFF